MKFFLAVAAYFILGAAIAIGLMATANSPFWGLVASGEIGLALKLPAFWMLSVPVAVFMGLFVKYGCVTH